MLASNNAAIQQEISEAGGIAPLLALLNGLAPDEQTYCVDGVQADAVFSVTKAPTLAGVAGTGGACAHDHMGIAGALVEGGVVWTRPRRARRARSCRAGRSGRAPSAARAFVFERPRTQ